MPTIRQIRITKQAPPEFQCIPLMLRSAAHEAALDPNPKAFLAYREMHMAYAEFAVLMPMFMTLETE